MTSRQPLFTQNPDCAEGGYLLSPAGVLLMVGNIAYGDDDDTPPSGRARAADVVRKMLSAARAGGFTKGDLLETLLAKGEVSHRVKELAHEAIDCAGESAVLEIIASIRGEGHD